MRQTHTAHRRDQLSVRSPFWDTGGSAPEEAQRDPAALGASARENGGAVPAAPGPGSAEGLPAELLSLSRDSVMNRLMLAQDWSVTPLGPPERWPRTLRTAVSVCLNSRFPMLIWWGPQLAMLYNDGYVPMLGDKHPDALGRPGAAVWADVWPVVGDMLAGVLERGAATYDEDLLLVMRRHGFDEEAYFTFSYSPIVTPGGAVGGVFTAVTETTGRVLAARRLAVLQRLGEIPTAQTATVENACAAAAEVLGAHRADIPFGLVYLLTDDGARARLVAHYGGIDTGCVPITLPAGTEGGWIWRAASSGRPVTATGLVDQLPGLSRASVSEIGGAQINTAVALPLPVAGQEQPVGILVAGVSPYLELNDDYQAFLELVAGQVTAVVTDAQAYERQRRRAEELAELDRAKTEFFTGVSHEFRTPLTLIMGPVTDLREMAELDPVRVRAELDVIHRNGLRLGKLVTSLLDFSRIQAGRIQAGYEPVDLATVTAELASVFRAAIERAGLTYLVDCAPLPEPVFVDRDMWEKIVLNLLSNALKFTFTGRVAVTLRTAGTSAVLQVADTGTGVPAAELPLLFERFHRVYGSRARSSEGSGIGLALTKELVELHGGTITAESTVDVGTTMTVTLPRGGAHLPAEQILPARPAAAVSPTAEPFVAEALRWLPAESIRSDPPRAGGQIRGRVLVADDNADMREYLRRLLTSRYHVSTTADGQAALQAARTDPPDLIVSDVMMPGLDGLELVAALRADPATASVPVLLLSARAGQEAAVEGLTAGADDYLVKPFAARELLARVGAHVELGRVRRTAQQRFQAMADATPALIWVSDGGGRRVFLNRGWLDYTGRDLAESVGDGWRDDVHPDDLSRYLDTASTAGPKQQPYEIEYRLRRHDGTYRWMIERAAPLDQVPLDQALLGQAAGTGYVAGLLDTDERHQDRWRQGLLAAIGAALDAEIGLDERMHRLTRLLIEHRLADLATVLPISERDELTRLSIAARDPAHEALVAQLPAESQPVRAVVSSGRSTLIAELTEDVMVEMFRDPELIEQRLRLGMASAVLLPLIARGTVLGVLSVLRGPDAPRYTAEDQALLEEISHRAGIALDNARLLAEEQASTRRLALLQAATAELSAAATPEQIVQAALRHGSVLLDTPAVAVLELRETGTLDLLAITGFDARGARDFATIPLDAPIPVSDAARECRPIWLETLADWHGHYPHLVEVTRELNNATLAALPLLTAGRCLGVLGFGFAQPRRFATADRDVALSLAGQCAQALDRARLYQFEHEVAQTLQRSLLPATLPHLAQLAIAAHYLPGAQGAGAGGDWYDVFPLDATRAAIAVGDVVGQGAPAAAVMGQLRSALTGYLLAGHPPAMALKYLDRFAARVDGATASSACCLIIDHANGELCWACAGHLPPLVLDAQGTRYLDGTAGTLLAVDQSPPFTEARTQLPPGASVVLYTDGLVERRGEVIDDGLARLAAEAGTLRAMSPDALADGLLRRMLAGAGPADDVALVVARLIPAPLRQRLPARVGELAAIRRTVRSWAQSAGLPGDLVDDLQLALGEAAANAVEHAYPADAPGELTYDLARGETGAIHVAVQDFGAWRPEPPDNHHRGRGLGLITSLATDVHLNPTPTGTTIQFSLLLPPSPRQMSRASHTEPTTTAALPRITTEDNGYELRLAIHGDLDLAGVTAIRPELLSQLTAARPLMLDLGPTSYLASAGVGLLIELAENAREVGIDLRILTDPHGMAHRILRLTGLDQILPVTSNER